MFASGKQNRTAKEEDRLRRYEREAAERPGPYRAKVLAAAVAGYAAPFLFLAGLFGLVAAGAIHVINGGSGGAAIIKLSIASAALGFVLARSMVVRFDPPDARLITRDDAPALFDLIDDVRGYIDGPEIHEVYIDNELNAAIQQAPRFGIFGGHRNRLMIGLPLMQALTQAQFKGVIAHEYGHLAGAHGKTGAWIYRTRAMWAQLQEKLHQRGTLLDQPLIFFIDRFAPYFDQLSFPLARANEYDADRTAADIVSGQTASDALVRINLAARYLEDVFWPSVNKHAQTCARPNVAPLRHSHKAFSQMSAWPQQENWRRENLMLETGYADTHPSLNDRIRAMDAEPRLTPLNGDRAIDILGPLYEKLRADFDAQWRDSVGERWAQTHDEAQKSLARLSELDQEAELTPLDPHSAIERASLAQKHIGVEAAIHRYKEAVVWDDANADAWLAIGSILAAQGNERALKCLDKAGKLQPMLRLSAASARYQYFSMSGDADAAMKAMGDIQAEEDRHRQAHHEIYAIDKTDNLGAHDLDAATLAQITAALEDISGIKRAYVLHKPSTIFPALNGYHLVIVPRSSRAIDFDAASAVLRTIAFSRPHSELYFWFAVDSNRWMAKYAQKIEGAALSFGETTPRDSDMADAA